MLQDRRDQLAGLAVENPRCVITDREDFLAVTARVCTSDLTFVANLAKQLAAIGIPNAKDIVVAGGEQSLSIQVEPDISYLGVVRERRDRRFAGGHIPDTGRSVLAGRRNEPAVRTERCLLDCCLM